MKVRKHLEEVVHHTLRILENPGLLLVSVDENGKPNVMTIGWGLIGVLWRKPIFIIAIRPSRFTHSLIETTMDFTVNVPKKGMEKIVNFCGTFSGREHDKFKACNLTQLPSKFVKSPVIKECVIHYECRVIYKHELSRVSVPDNVISEIYPQNDFHTIYFGEILAIYADEDYEETLP